MTTPRISLNKLGEYLTASPSRRRRIVLDQQDPKAFIVARYSDAREAIVDYMVSGMIDRKKLLSEAKLLRMEDGGSDFSRQDREASADAIEAFAEIGNQIDVGDLIIVPVPNSSSDGMEISGVNVSVRPDVYLKNFITSEIVGAIKLHFPKSTPLNQNSAEYVATALRVFLENGRSSSTVDYKKCYAVDVSTQNVVHAPKAFTRKMNDIAAACEEISARWRINQVTDF